MGKRLVFLSSLAALNIIFAVKDISLAVKDVDPLYPDNSINGSMVVVNGAVMARGYFPEPQNFYYIQPKKTITVVATGYSSSIDETDDTPFITASGSFVRSGVAASNFLPFGTRFRVPEIYGDKVFIVEDRMNSRYDGKSWVDIWFENKNQAMMFGKKTAEIEIL